MAELEERVVEVNDPKLSEDANRRLTHSLREVLGTDRVEVPVGRTRVSQGERPKAPITARLTSTAVMAIGVVAVALGVGFIILTAEGGHWWLTGVSMVVLAGALAVVTMSIIGLASTPEYPDPGLVALLSEEGVLDPEIRFSELVHEFTPVPEDREHRSADVAEDPARAAAEQTEAVTPSGGPSQAVGPGD